MISKNKNIVMENRIKGNCIDILSEDKVHLASRRNLQDKAICQTCIQIVILSYWKESELLDGTNVRWLICLQT